MPADVLRFGLLGPVQAWSGERMLDTGSPQQRAVLAALAVDAGRAVPAETVVSRVWGQDAPDGAQRTLYSYITRIRRFGAPVVRRAGGYVLDVDADQVDVHRFRGLVVRSRDQDDVARAGTLREALALWRGEPLAGLAGDWAGRVREAWHRQRADAVQAWAGAETRIGNVRQTLGTLRELVAEHPTSEPLVAALMAALLAADQDAEALQVYADARARLADQLGSDPGAQLQALYQQALRADAGEPAAGPTAAGGEPGVPAQLPATAAGFAGREELLARLDAGLDRAGADGAAVPIFVLSGMPGVGKTALAVRWAHRVAGRFPDGQLYVNLRGFDPAGQPLPPAEAVRNFLDALGVPRERVPAGLDAQAALYRSLLAGKRVLVVLDNAADPDQVRPLLPGTPPAAAIVTSRNQLTPLVTAGAQPVPMGVLPDAEARALLANRLGAARLAAEPQAVDDIVAGCARLPLALTITAARAATNPTFPLAALAGELAEARGRLDTLAAGDPATEMRTVLSWSYATLSEGAARLFRLVGLPAGPDLSAAAAASLAGADPAKAQALLDELARTSMVAEHAPGRYALHDLLGAYAAELAERDAERLGAIRRLLDHYVHTAHAAELLLDPSRERLRLDPVAAGVSPERLASADRALAWFGTEAANLSAAVRQAAALGFDTHTWQLAAALLPYLDGRGDWQELAATQELAVGAAERLGDQGEQARAHHGLARARGRFGDSAAALTHLRRAGELYGAAGNRSGQARTNLSLGAAHGMSGSWREALAASEHALELFRQTGERLHQAMALNSIGWSKSQLGDHHGAIESCRAALAVQQELGIRQHEAASWDSIGFAHHHLGDYAEATACYRRALEIYRDLRHRYGEAEILTHLGDSQQAAGDQPSARITWTAALDILTELDHPDAAAVRTRLAALPPPP